MLAGMELVLVRHAEPEWAREGLSIDNPSLTDRGREQAKRLAERFVRERFDTVLVSTMTRARETAEPILHAIEAEAVYEEWLEEIRMPDWTGTPSAEVDEAFQRARARPLEDQWHGMPGGESFWAFHERVTTGLEAHLAEVGVTPYEEDSPLWEVDDPARRVLIVAHAGTNATLIGHMLGIQPLPWEWERFVMYHASFSVLQPIRIGGAWSFSLERLGDREHLPDDMRTR